MKRPPNRIYIIDCGTFWEFGVSAKDAECQYDSVVFHGEAAVRPKPVAYIRLDPPKHPRPRTAKKRGRK